MERYQPTRRLYNSSLLMLELKESLESTSQNSKSMTGNVVKYELSRHPIRKSYTTSMILKEPHVAVFFNTNEVLQVQNLSPVKTQGVLTVFA